MSKRSLTVFIVLTAYVLALSGTCHAYWMWTPETKKFVNPKNAVKDTPKEQFNWAMSLYNAKDYTRAAFEFDKLAKQYEFSDYASKSQYYVGLCYENMQKYYIAFENYQKAIDNFPHLSNTDEVLARQYAIGIIYMEKPNPKVLGNDIMAPLDRAVEIFKKVVENAPFGKYAADAQFKLAQALKKSERYDEAVQAFHKITEDYPKSKYIKQATYEEADCAYKASLKPAYDASATTSAIKTFEKFVDRNKDANLAQDADRTMRRLKDSIAEKSFKAAQFYELVGKKEAAIIYYQDVIDAYPQSSFVNQARARIEALKNPAPKAVFAPIDIAKKKPAKPPKAAGSAGVTQKKSSWRPLDFTGERPAAKKMPEKRKASWNPLNLFGQRPKSAPKPEAVKTETQAEAKRETPKKISWWPFGGAAKSKKPAEETKRAPAWKPFNFMSAKKPPVKEKDTAEWRPLNFDAGTDSSKEFVESPAIEPVNPAAPAADATDGSETEALTITDLLAQSLEESRPIMPVQPESVIAPAVVVAAENPVITEPVFNEQPAPVEKAPESDSANLAPAKEKKGWKPFNFSAPKNDRPREKKPWVPLYFGTSDAPMTQDAQKRAVL